MKLIKTLDQDWKDFDKGKTIGKPGHEGGAIVSDIENVHGARVVVPYAFKAHVGNGPGLYCRPEVQNE